MLLPEHAGGRRRLLHLCAISLPPGGLSGEEHRSLSRDFRPVAPVDPQTIMSPFRGKLKLHMNTTAPPETGQAERQGPGPRLTLRGIRSLAGSSP